MEINMPFEKFDRSELNLLPLGDRIHDIDLKEVLRDVETYAPEFTHPHIDKLAEAIGNGCRKHNATVLMMYGAHVIRTGNADFMIELMKRGLVTHFATNGAGSIHDFEFAKIDGKYALDVLYDTVPAEYLQTELDVCWVNVGGEVPADYIRKYSGRPPVVHLKDFHGEKSENMYELIGINTAAPKRPSNFDFRPVGSGLNDFPAILEAAAESGAQWVIVEQDNPSMGLTPLQCAEKSRNYLKSIGC